MWSVGNKKTIYVSCDMADWQCKYSYSGHTVSMMGIAII